MVFDPRQMGQPYMAGNIGGAVRPMAMPQEPNMGFGQYFKDIPAIQHLLMAAGGNYARDLLGGYGAWQKGEEAEFTQEIFRKVDNLLLNDPEIKNADWSDPSFGRNVQKYLINKGIPGNLVDDIMDQYHFDIDDKGISTALYWDQDTNTIVGHQQIQPGTIITGERYAKVNIDLARKDPIYRNYLVSAHGPKIKPWIEEKFGKVASDKKSMDSFRNRLESGPDEWKNMIAEGGLVPFTAMYKKAYGIQFKPFPEEITRKYDDLAEIMNAPVQKDKKGNIIYDPAAGLSQNDIDFYNKVSSDLQSFIGSSNKSDTDTTNSTTKQPQIPQAAINILDRLPNEQFIALQQQAYDRLEGMGNSNPTEDELLNVMMGIMGREMVKRMQQGMPGTP